MKKVRKKMKKIKKDIGAHGYMIVVVSVGLYIGVFSLIMIIDMIGKEFDKINRQKVSFDRTNPEILHKTAEMLQGYPMVAMAPYIAQEDPQVAAFLVAIAKKESAWGKRAPKLGGADCYNYWGFRQKRDRMGTGGHTCFDSPQEAVKIVADRIEDLIDKKYDTPQKMVVWKCGYSCYGHSNTSVSKWVQDVDYYYDMMYP
jgi:hypothetical protein